MSRGVLVALAVLMLAPGCSKKKATPEGVYRQFHGIMLKYARAPYPGYRDQAYALLSKDAQAVLQARADAVNEALPAGVEKMSPESMLKIRGLRQDTPIKTMEVTGRTDDLVTLKVEFEGAADTVQLVREGVSWRVALFGTGDGE